MNVWAVKCADVIQNLTKSRCFGSFSSVVSDHFFQIEKQTNDAAALSGKKKKKLKKM